MRALFLTILLLPSFGYAVTFSDLVNGKEYFPSEICEDGCDIYYLNGTQVYEDPNTGHIYRKLLNGNFVKI